MVYIIMAAIIFGADSVIKYIVENKVEFNKEREILNKRFIIKKYHNTGAMLNAGEKKQHLVSMVSLAFTAFLTGVFVVTLGRKGKNLLKTGLSLILGGAFSNTYDRLIRKYVVDYVAFKVDINCKPLKKLQNVIFNISDFAIIIGAVILVCSAKDIYE